VSREGVAGFDREVCELGRRWAERLDLWLHARAEVQEVVYVVDLLELGLMEGE